MRETRIISWIFLAIAIASQRSVAGIRTISSIADGIDHSIPTAQELKMSIAWLLKKKLIREFKGKYGLTKYGFVMYDSASLKTPYALDAWKNLKNFLERIK